MAKIQISRPILNKIVIGMIWFVIPLLILASILLFSELINNPQINIIEFFGSTFGIFLILFFAVMLVISVTKYKKEILLNDNERKEKWGLLRKDYRDFFRKMIIFEFILYGFMVLFGVYFSFNPGKNDELSGIYWIFLGLIFLVSTFHNMKKLKNLEKQSEIFNQKQLKSRI